MSSFWAPPGASGNQKWKDASSERRLGSLRRGVPRLKSVDLGCIWKPFWGSLGAGQKKQKKNASKKGPVYTQVPFVELHFWASGGPHFGLILGTPGGVRKPKIEGGFEREASAKQTLKEASNERHPEKQGFERETSRNQKLKEASNESHPQAKKGRRRQARGFRKPKIQ